MRLFRRKTNDSPSSLSVFNNTPRLKSNSIATNNNTYKGTNKSKETLGNNSKSQDVFRTKSIHPSLKQTDTGGRSTAAVDSFPSGNVVKANNGVGRCVRGDDKIWKDNSRLSGVGHRSPDVLATAGSTVSTVSTPDLASVCVELAHDRTEAPDARRGIVTTPRLFRPGRLIMSIPEIRTKIRHMLTMLFII